MDNGTLSPVFNIRGMYFNENSADEGYTEFKLYTKEDEDNENSKPVRNYVTFNEETGIVYKDDAGASTNEFLENAFGVVRVYSKENELTHIRGIKVDLVLDEDDKKVFFQELKKCNVKGMFFVRQKRMPLRLCQAYTIGVDPESHTPLLYVEGNTNIASGEKGDSDSGEVKGFYVSERFINDEKELKHDIEDRLYAVKAKDVAKYGAICPEYDVNSPYLNTLFCGDEYIIMEAAS